MTAPQQVMQPVAPLGTSPSGSALEWSVSGLLLAISDALAARFAAVSVHGELINFTRAASGHCYFTLKDPLSGAGLRCAMFRRAAQLLDFRPADGQQVRLRGRLAVYEARGELQLVVEAMQRVGSGALYEEFLRLKAALAAQGLFDAQRKRVPPPHPRRLALITSSAGAALHDVLSSLARRAPHVEVLLCPAPVQGAEAPMALVAALAAANAWPDVDTILLCRGGGSLEDLWAFNDERLVRAIAASPRPVICGVGHETDVTLADLAADLRAPTPTAAAELATPATSALLQDLQWRAQTLMRRVDQRLQESQQRLDHLSLRCRQPSQRLGQDTVRLAALASRHHRALDQLRQGWTEGQRRRADRLLRVGRATLTTQAQRLQGLADRLQALDPRRVLQRGYAWVENEQGQPLLSAAVLRPGQALQAVWLDGRAEVTVERIRMDPPTGNDPGGVSPKRRP